MPQASRRSSGQLTLNVSCTLMEKTPKYFAIGLRLGIIDPIEVQDWVNKELFREESPSDQLLELAYTKSDQVHELYHTLLEMKDDSNTYEIVRKLLGTIKEEKVESLNFCRDLARNLYGIWVDNDYKSPDDLSEIGFFDDAFDLADIGSYGTLDEVHSDFRRFVASFKRGS